MSRSPLAVAMSGIFCMSMFCSRANAAPELTSATIMAFTGSDANRNGYYETFGFEFELWAVGEEGQTYNVAARLYCTTTDQGWNTESWTVAGPASEMVSVVFDQSDFSLIGVHDLDFRVELWDADFSTQHADAAAVAGEPVSVEMSDSGVPAPLQPTLAAPSETSMVLSLADDGGPADTVYCVLVVSSPVDASRNGNYIWPFEGLGQRFDAPVWKPLDAWQNLLVTNPALKPNTTYSFMARAKLDGAESAYGAAASLATLAAPPGQCMVPGVSAVSMSIAIDPADNPGRALFAIKCMATDPADSRYDQRWIDACGYPACDPEWQTALQWLSTGAAGLRPLTAYTFAARARNIDGAESAFGPATGARTSTAGDVNGDCVVNILDMLSIRVYLYTQPCTGPGTASADLNGDGWVNILDLLTCRMNLRRSCPDE